MKYFAIKDSATTGVTAVSFLEIPDDQVQLFKNSWSGMVEIDKNHYDSVRRLTDRWQTFSKPLNNSST